MKKAKKGFEFEAQGPKRQDIQVVLELWQERPSR